jgi:hypothetical protein
MAKHELAVHKVEGKFKVHLPVLIVHDTDTVEWTGYGTDIKVHIPKSKKQPAKTGKTNEVSWTVDTKLDPPGEYIYSVHCEADETFAQGGSDPKIIVKGP